MLGNASSDFVPKICLQGLTLRSSLGLIVAMWIWGLDVLIDPAGPVRRRMRLHELSWQSVVVSDDKLFVSPLSWKPGHLPLSEHSWGELGQCQLLGGKGTRILASILLPFPHPFLTGSPSCISSHPGVDWQLQFSSDSAHTGAWRTFWR